MKAFYIICMAIAALSASAYAEKKLQIGIKKRVDPEDCKIKSRKGDKLQMHYTVRASIHHINNFMLGLSFVLMGLTDYGD